MDGNFIPGNKKLLFRLAIADPDLDYMQDIDTFYKTTEPMIEVVYIANTYDELISYVTTHEVEVIILSQQLLSDASKEIEEIVGMGIPKIVITTDNLEELKKREFIKYHDKIDFLFKYTPMSLYSQRILSFEPSENVKKPKVNPIKSKDQPNVVLFYSPKGGVGKTTLSINTACQLVQKGKKVLLVDFAIFGNVSVALSLSQRTLGLTEVISHVEQSSNQDDETQRITIKSIQPVKIGGQYLDVLSAASAIKMSSMKLEVADKVIETIKKLDYDVIIIDTSAELSEKNIVLISEASELFFVTTTDIAACWSLLMTFELIQSLNRPMQNHYLILNKYKSSIGFPIKEMEQILGIKVSYIIPDMYEQIQGYANKGILLAEKSYLDINKYYRRVANLVFPIFSDKELGRRKWLFSKRRD